MSRCSHPAAESLPEYVRSQLDPEAVEMVSRHLQTCVECALEESLIRALEREDLPAPEPWFFTALPGKVTAQVNTRRKRRRIALLPAWAGGMAAALVGMWLLLQPDLNSRPELSVNDYSLVETVESIPLGLEEELFSASGRATEDLDQLMLGDLQDLTPDSILTTQLVVEGEGYETMDGETIRVFEELLDKMTAERLRKKVMS